MAFVPQLYEIVLDDRIKGAVTTYRRSTVNKVGNSIRCMMIESGSASHEVVTASDGNVSVAIMTEENNVLPISEKSSRLFCDFPLIDTVPFPFPAVVNSSSFRVNEPRSCITLTDNPNSTDSETNKKLIRSAVTLYSSLLDYLLQRGCGKLYNAVYTPKVFSRSDISESWIKTNIISKVAETAACKAMFRGKDSNISAAYQDIHIPDPAYPDMAEDINELLYGL